MFDGDGDSPDKPDIGYIMGRLRDTFAHEGEKVAFVTGQKKSWYYPSRPGGNLTNSNGLEYETFVFEDNKFPGDHNRFTQSDKLVNAKGYEQWYIGASGPIASEQLEDYNGKVKEGNKQKVVMFRAPLNENLEDGIKAKLEKARTDGDEAKVTKFEDVLRQRENKYGVHWDNEGNPKIDPDQYANLDIEFVAA